MRSDPAFVSRLVELEKRMEQLGEKTEWAESIAGLEDVDFFVKQDLAHLAKLLTMSDKEFTGYLNLVREHRKPMRSLVEEPPAIAASERKG